MFYLKNLATYENAPTRVKSTVGKNLIKRVKTSLISYLPTFKGLFHTKKVYRADHISQLLEYSIAMASGRQQVAVSDNILGTDSCPNATSANQVYPCPLLEWAVRLRD